MYSEMSAGSFAGKAKPFPQGAGSSRNPPSANDLHKSMKWNLNSLQFLPSKGITVEHALVNPAMSGLPHGPPVEANCWGACCCV